MSSSGVFCFPCTCFVPDISENQGQIHPTICPHDQISLSVISRAVISTFPALAPGLNFPYAVPIRNSGNKGPLEGRTTYMSPAINVIENEKEYPRVSVGIEINVKHGF